MYKITMPTTLRPVQIARLLEREGSPLAPLAEEIYDLAVFYRIDAAFALAQCMVESKLGCTVEAQANRSAALVPLEVARMAAPAAGAAIPILPPRYGDEYGMGYVTYPSWLTGLEEYFRILRLVFVDARHEERVEDVARAFLFSAPNRRAAVPRASASPRPAGGKARTRHHPHSARQGALPPAGLRSTPMRAGWSAFASSFSEKQAPRPLGAATDNLALFLEHRAIPRSGYSLRAAAASRRRAPVLCPRQRKCSFPLMLYWRKSIESYAHRALRIG